MGFLRGFEGGEKSDSEGMRRGMLVAWIDDDPRCNGLRYQWSDHVHSFVPRISSHRIAIAIVVLENCQRCQWLVFRLHSHFFIMQESPCF